MSEDSRMETTSDGCIEASMIYVSLRTLPGVFAHTAGCLLMIFMYVLFWSPVLKTKRHSDILTIAAQKMLTQPVRTMKEKNKLDIFATKPVIPKVSVRLVCLA